MKRLVMAMALTGVFFISALAGDMPTTDSPTPGAGGTPRGVSWGWPSPVAGDIPNVDAAQSVLDGGLSALLSILGLVV